MDMKCFPWQAVAKPLLVVPDVERITRPCGLQFGRYDTLFDELSKL